MTTRPGDPHRWPFPLCPLGTAPYIELFSLACKVLAGCQACMQSHEAAVVHGGLSEDHVHETVRIAAVVQGFLVALGLG